MILITVWCQLSHKQAKINMNEVRLTTGKNQQYLGNVKEEELGIQSQENSRNREPKEFWLISIYIHQIWWDSLIWRGYLQTFHPHWILRRGLWTKRNFRDLLLAWVLIIRKVIHMEFKCQIQKMPVTEEDLNSAYYP